MRTLTLLLLLLFLIPFADAQNVPFKPSAFPDQGKELRKARKAMKKGTRLTDKGEHRHHEALLLLRAAHDFNPNNGLLNWRIGSLIFEGDNPAEALSYLSKAWELDSSVNRNLPYMLARTLHLNLRFDEARHFYTVYHNSMKRGNARRWDPVYQRYIAQLNTADSLMALPNGLLMVTVENVGNRINSSYPEYAPVPVPGGEKLWFTSRRPGSTGGQTDKSNRYFEDIYYLVKVGEIWSDPINAGENINTGEHESAVAVSPDGKELYIRMGNPNGNLYVIRTEGRQSKKPGKLSKRISSKANENWITFSPDSTRLWFVSDRRGGQGGNDIWMSEANKRGKWKKPVNAGPGINTPFDEMSPFIAVDGKTLFFSSQGHNGMGGFDVFMSTFENGTYSTPVNLGYPVNTPSNDLHFSWCMNTGEGWMASDRPGGYGSYDLYRVPTIIDPSLELFRFDLELEEEIEVEVEVEIEIEVEEVEEVEIEVEEVEEVEIEIEVEIEVEEVEEDEIEVEEVEIEEVDED